MFRNEKLHFLAKARPFHFPTQRGATTRRRLGRWEAPPLDEGSTVTGTVPVMLPVKRHRGEPGHTGHTGHTGAHGCTRLHTDHKDEPHNQSTIQTQVRHTRTTTRRPNDRGRLNSRRPGADRSLERPTQKRPPPANPTLPPPAPRAPPRACSKAVGEMKARAAEA